MARLQSIDIDPKTFLRQHFTLPALPEVVSQVQNLIQDDNADMAQVAQLISGEPALVAQVLKVVNSAYYGLPREVTKVNFAIAFLGLSEVYRMILSLSVIDALAIKERGELNKFWFHSFYSAMCTKFIAKRYEPQLSFEELWSAGILHDIGKLVYLRFFPDHYKALRRFSQEHGCLFSEAERDLSLPTSFFLGTLLCDHWRLPGTIRAACEFHSLKDLPNIKADSASGSFQRMVCLGNLLAVLATDELKNATRQEIVAATSSALDCTEAQFLAMMGDIYELRIEVESFMDHVR
jgi:HD-like signal output (HDOD) protein